MADVWEMGNGRFELQFEQISLFHFRTREGLCKQKFLFFDGRMILLSHLDESGGGLVHRFLNEFVHLFFF